MTKFKSQIKRGEAIKLSNSVLKLLKLQSSLQNKSLKFTANEFAEEGLTILIQSLKSLKEIQRFSLDCRFNEYLDDESFRDLSFVLKPLKKVQSFSLDSEWYKKLELWMYL